MFPNVGLQAEVYTVSYQLLCFTELLSKKIIFSYQARGNIS